MVVSVLDRGGCERQLLATVTGLLSRGYTVRVFLLANTAKDAPSFAPELATLGIAPICAADFAAPDALPGEATDRHGLRRFAPIIEPFDIAGLGLALEEAIRDFRPDIVHCWSEPSSIIGGFVAASLGVRLTIVQLVSVPPFLMGAPAAPVYREAYRLLARSPNVLMLNISSKNARDLEQWLELAPDTVKLLRNGFLPSSVRIRQSHEFAECRGRLGLPPGVPTVGAVTRFADEKDPDLWLRTAAVIAAARPDVHFVLCGYGALADWIRTRVRELGLAERFVITGPAYDVGAIYAALDVFLMTSRFEGTPNALVEAQAAGVPVVTPAVGGTPETVLDGLTGFVVPIRTAEHLAEAALRILGDPLWRQLAAAQGPDFVARRFDWRRKIDQTIAFYGAADGIDGQAGVRDDAGAWQASAAT
jgi:glycosyltransferase involved in cell wall biosynthesis